VRLRLLASALGVLAALDIATSLWGLTHGLAETAPAMSAVVNVFGIWAIAPLKALLTLLIFALIARVTYRSRALAWAIALGVFVIPVVNNILLIQASQSVVP
jgi:hypothetical protein